MLTCVPYLDIDHDSSLNNINSQQSANIDREVDTRRKPDRHCCGSYPRRILYPIHSNKGCCHNKVYDKLMSDCCESGIQSIGGC